MSTDQIKQLIDALHVVENHEAQLLLVKRILAHDAMQCRSQKETVEVLNLEQSFVSSQNPEVAELKRQLGLKQNAVNWWINKMLGHPGDIVEPEVAEFRRHMIRAWNSYKNGLQVGL